MYKVYKAVTRRTDNKLYSYNVALAVKSKYELEYDIGKTTIPTIPNSLLFAFLSKEEAFEMIKGTDAEVYLAETHWYVTGIVPQKDYEFNKSAKCNYIENFWKNYKNPSDSYTDNRVKDMEKFKTSICCPSLKLLERVC